MKSLLHKIFYSLMECANELLKALKQDEDILELINSRSLELN